MTKKDIVVRIAEQLDLPQLRTRELVQRTFDALIDTLVEEGRVELRNFGVFQVKLRDARMGRNPRTGQRVSVEAKAVVTFKPGKEMEARVRERTNSLAAGNSVTDDHSIYEDMDDASENDDSGDGE
jgi:integration host factor subunit beta